MQMKTNSGKTAEIFPAGGKPGYYQMWITGKGKVATRATWSTVQRLLAEN